MKTGRPPLYDTPEQMEQAIDAYFKKCEESEGFPNVPELCYELGFTDRHAFKDTEKRSPEFSSTIKRAREKMIGMKLQGAAKGKLNPTIVIFDAVNNHGCVNTRTENKNSTTGSLTVTHELSPSAIQAVEDIQRARITE